MVNTKNYSVKIYNKRNLQFSITSHRITNNITYILECVTQSAAWLYFDIVTLVDNFKDFPDYEATLTTYIINNLDITHGMKLTNDEAQQGIDFIKLWVRIKYFIIL